MVQIQEIESGDSGLYPLVEMAKLQRLRNSLVPIKGPVEPVLQLFARSAAAWASLTHKMLLWWQWGIAPLPEYFDHQIDLHHYWRASRDSLWVERGVFSSLCLDGGDVLELCCGDGFHARNFYSLRSRRIVACDFDPKAIDMARRTNQAPNIEFVVADIRTAMPEGQFGTVIWDGAIEHFTEDEVVGIVGAIKQRLKSRGILCGYTIVETGHGLSLPHHEHEFKNKAELLRMMSPHFANVRVFETVTPNRRNLYLWASDGTIPFDTTWSSQVSAVRSRASTETGPT